MSADNGLYVTHLRGETDPKLAAPPKYGVFHYFASSTDYMERYTRENSRSYHYSAVDAILAAHDLQQEEKTEHGVSIHPKVLAEAQEEFDHLGD